jgi:uncharacterized membrane protein YgcG
MPLELLTIALGYIKGRSDYWTRMLRAGNPLGTGNDEPSAWIMGGAPSRSTNDSSGGIGSSSSSDFGGGSSGGGGASGHW